MEVDLKGHFLNLYMIALSDNNFDEKELEVILKIGEEKGISAKEFEEIILNPTSIKIKVPEDFESKLRLLFDFARVIWSDGKIEEDERLAFLKFSDKFGFKDEEGVELFNWLIELAKNNCTTDGLEIEINKLLNS